MLYPAELPGRDAHSSWNAVGVQLFQAFLQLVRQHPDIRLQYHAVAVTGHFEDFKVTDVRRPPVVSSIDHPFRIGGTTIR